MKKLFLDFDNTIVNSSKAYCDVYNELFRYMDGFSYVNWKDIQEYNIRKYCTLTNEFSKSLFDIKLFFDKLEFLDDNTNIVIQELCNKYDVHICTIGTPDNISLKAKWIDAFLPCIKNLIFISNQGNKHDKSIVDMSGGILIDDNLDCLDSSNAEHKFIAGDIVEYNTTKKYIRLKDWTTIYNGLCSKNVL